jgi:hypothetical protein
LSHGLSIFQGEHGGKDTLKLEETKDGLKGALGSKKTETDKSATVPVGDGPLPPPKPVSPNQLTVPFVLPFYQSRFILQIFSLTTVKI